VRKMADETTLEVVRLGDPVLRAVAQKVPSKLVGSEELRQLEREMIATMGEQHGVGLAAPQIGEGLRLFVYWVPDDEGDPLVHPHMLVNPEIRPVGTDEEEDWEGCLSIPGLRGLVPRYRRIKVKAMTAEGELVSLTADGFQARVIQHECDHLDGVVFLDRMRSMDSLSFEEEWVRFVAEKEMAASG